MATKTVYVTPGRVAYTTVNGKVQFTSKPVTVLWDRYLEELLNVHGDIQEVKTPGGAASASAAAAASLAAKAHVNVINVNGLASAS
jgi:hypothetical protein